MEATIATMIVVVAEAMAAAADMVAEDVTKTATVDLLATMTVAMGAAMTTDPEASTAMLRAVMTATAAVEMIDVAGLTTVVVTNPVAMVGILLPRENLTAEVGATRTATIGTLVVRLRTANSIRYGAPLEVMRPHLAAKLDFQLRQHLHQRHRDVKCSVSRMPVSGFLKLHDLRFKGSSTQKGLLSHLSPSCLFSTIRRCQEGSCGQHSGNGLSGQHSLSTIITRHRSMGLRDCFILSKRASDYRLLARRLQLATLAPVAADQRLP